MYIFLAIIIVLAVLFMITRLRLRLDLASGHKLLFVGLGRSGPEFQLGEKKGRLKLFGFQIRSFQTGGKQKPEKKAKGQVPADVGQERKAEPEKQKAGRRRSVRDIVSIVPQCSRALWLYFMDLLRASIIEQAEGEIEGGFDSPDLTGQAYGFYSAAMGAAPALAGRFRYVPDWTGASFSGAARLTVALPMYRLAARTLVLIWRLPIRKIVKLAIGEKGGVQDG